MKHPPCQVCGCQNVNVLANAVAEHRFEVRPLLSGAGFVIVDTAWEFPMIGPYRKRSDADQRAAEFEADPSCVPPKWPA